MRKIWIFIASVLVLVGCGIFTVTMTACNWDFNKLSTQKNVTNTYEISEQFNNISIDTDTADICFVPSDDGKCKVVCQEFEKEKHSVSTDNGTLTIKAVNERKWYDYIGVNFGKTKLTVYLPNTEYQSLVIKEDTGDVEIPSGFIFDSIDMDLTTGDVDLTGVTCKGELKICVTTGDVEFDGCDAPEIVVETSTGDVDLTGVTCKGELKICVTTGDVEIQDVTCKTFVSSGDTGELSMDNVVASEKISIERSTGDVEFEGCDAPEIVVETSTGDVEGSLLTGKEFIVETDTGKKRVPENQAGGRCQITTDTGDIKITIK